MERYGWKKVIWDVGWYKVNRPQWLTGREDEVKDMVMDKVNKQHLKTITVSESDNVEHL